MKHLYFFDAGTGACTKYAGSWMDHGETALAALAGRERPNQGDLEWWADEHLGKAEELNATIEAEEITSVTVVTPPEMFLHANVTAPGTGPTGVPSVASGETASITADLRAGEEETSSLMPFGGTIRVPYRKNGVYHGELRMEFVSGQCVYTFSPLAHHHGTLSINQEDFDLLNGYKVRVVGDAKLIVDEVSAA